MSLYKSSPPGHSTFFLLSPTRGNVAPNIAAVHDLQLAVGRLDRTTGQNPSERHHYGHQCGKQNCQFAHGLVLGFFMIRLARKKQAREHTYHTLLRLCSSNKFSSIYSDSSITVHCGPVEPHVQSISEK